MAYEEFSLLINTNDTQSDSPNGTVKARDSIAAGESKITFGPSSDKSTDGVKTDNQKPIASFWSELPFSTTTTTTKPVQAENYDFAAILAAADSALKDSRGNTLRFCFYDE